MKYFFRVKFRELQITPKSKESQISSFTNFSKFCILVLIFFKGFKLSPTNFKKIVNWFMFWTGQKANPIMTRGLSTHETKARHMKEHINLGARHLTTTRLRVSNIIHVSFNRLLITRRISWRQLFSRSLV